MHVYAESADAQAAAFAEYLHDVAEDPKFMHHC